MRYQPYEDEYAAVPGMDDGQLLEYFLYRVFETEEIWGLKESAHHWLNHEINGQLVQPLWPYKRYADEAAVEKWENYVAVAVSLEYFMEQSLQKLATNDILIEIMPRKSATGCLISPQRLFSILEGMMESSQYTLDG